MDKLLNWSLAQQDPETAKKVGAPDPKLLAELFGQNVDDATLMKQNIELIENPECDEDNKLTAFDNFEMLIENLDNANNIENLKLWPKLINLLDSENDEFKNLTSSIIGTSVQNNEKSQTDFLKYPQGFTKLISLAKSNKVVRIKALYALSNLIRNNEQSYELFDQHKGWELLGPIITDKEAKDKVKLRSLSLLGAILSIAPKDDIKKHIHEYSIIEKILSLIKPGANISVVDKSLNLIVHLINGGYEFNDDEVKQVKESVEIIEKDFHDVINIDDFQVLKQIV
ncbi:hypothetical protein WICANDRAFT_63896 [Wickerhamomyces anomalus NRRL Y-366-8]|uniref:Hsp70 nucleotide exchange factor FES1 n=1 Tax=Wickerhamomyces anomalus (strain ATCC 58044 / CBS 1984 / NCYC 433 / NRRL Y-366-8) TaxID=683960 RepID=A0A1E3P1N9_WICAA|nr:uncharacterized protein WICANDRAFT_63896 [Wickerhamomyces anomalus NRRL Y-366-8]ODQ59399.1 hypothetical protein WICANDRAFT_63896 [Wickerhamomyces anomalus NRRL Y-366-8]